MPIQADSLFYFTDLSPINSFVSTLFIPKSPIDVGRSLDPYQKGNIVIMSTCVVTINHRVLYRPTPTGPVTGQRLSLANALSPVGADINSCELQFGGLCEFVCVCETVVQHSN